MGASKSSELTSMDSISEEATPLKGALHPILDLSRLKSPLEVFREVWQQWLGNTNALSTQKPDAASNVTDKMYTAKKCDDDLNGDGGNGVNTMTEASKLKELDAGGNVVYVAVEVDVADGTFAGVTDIGLSMWLPASAGDSISYHWHIDESGDSNDSPDYGHPDSFAFGQTVVITSAQISVVLDDWFLSFSRIYKRICLVQYGKSTLSCLEPEWSIPPNVIRLDAQKIWQQLDGATGLSPLQQAVATVDRGVGTSTLLENLGNKTHFTMIILREILRRMKGKAECHQTWVHYRECNH
ncbi:hypothetical protein TruAng_005020 [Truncatella angustata]|nr:hypothetical protein TruAng_005020 [Truncatella angustata]